MQRILVSDLPDRLTTAAMIAAGGSWLAGRALLTGSAVSCESSTGSQVL